jgi:uncharacterized protein
MRVVRNLLAIFLTCYHKVLSPFLPRACRFHPSCSVYTSEAMIKHGILKGAFLGLQRLSRCHPWSPGGYDPVR